MGPLRLDLLKTNILIATLLVGALLPTTALSDDGTVTFQVSLGSHLAPPSVECELAVPTPTTGAAVLDSAVATGCIDSWQSASFPGFGRYVTCINDLCEQTGTFWGYYINEQPSSCGIDHVGSSPGEPCEPLVQASDVVEFAYTDWFTPFLVGL